MEAALPTNEAVAAIESRQDEVLRQLTELEVRIKQALAEFGDQRTIPFPTLGPPATSKAA